MEKLIDDACTKRYPVSGKIWCDDYTDVYVGRCDKLSEVVGHHDWKGKEISSFKTTAQCCDYLYFVCWSNDSGLNGLLAEIAGSGTTIYSNAADWEVFSTGLDFDGLSPRPSHASVLEQIEKADCHHYWVKPFQGPKNVNTPPPTPFGSAITGISGSAHFIWHNTGLDSSGNAPFNGFNHNEYLIFRLPAKKLFPRECEGCTCEDCDCCDCGCDGCNEHASAQEKVLAKRATDKFNTVVGSTNVPTLCQRPYAQNQCKPALSVKKLNLCFYLHWGDSAADTIEDDDTETLYLTVCNPYADLMIKGLRIIKLTLVPAQPLPLMEIVPDSFICFDCLYPCSCKSRAFALITRKVPPGAYTIEVEYCVDEVSVTMDISGKTSFQITVIPD